MNLTPEHDACRATYAAAYYAAYPAAYNATYWAIHEQLTKEHEL